MAREYILGIRLYGHEISNMRERAMEGKFPHISKWARAILVKNMQPKRRSGKKVTK